MKPGLDDTTDRVSKVKYLVMIVEDVRLLDSLERSGLLTCRLCYFLSISILLGHSPQQLQRNRRREDYTSRGLHRLWIRMIAIDSVGSLDIVDTNLVIRMCIYTSCPETRWSREYADLTRCAQYLAESLSRGTVFVRSLDARHGFCSLIWHPMPLYYSQQRLGLAFMINPPWIFSAFWKIISRFLDPVTANKIIFTDKSGSATLEHIDAENLETVYAGTNDFQYNYEQWRESRFPGETLDSDE